MRILFDQGTPAPLRRRLEAHQVDTAAERGMDRPGQRRTPGPGRG
jgi:hypothetical protein